MKNFIKLTTLVLMAAMFVSLCATPAGAQTQKELKLYNKIMKARTITDVASIWNYPFTLKNRIKKQLAKLNHDDLLYQIASTHPQELIGVATANEIDNQELLIRLATPSSIYPLKHVKVLAAAMERITDRETYMQIFLEHPVFISSSLFRTLTSEEMMRLFKEAKFDISQVLPKDFYFHLISYPEVLDYILFEESLSKFHSNVVPAIEDQDLLMKVVKEHRDIYVRRQAFSRLYDASMEALAASVVDDTSLMMAIGIRVGKSDWDTEIGKSQNIGEVISAMTLVPPVAKPTIANITDVCHKYIRKGDEENIPDLELLLMAYGDKTLAEDYLNCGNQKLRAAAIKWSNAHGYNVNSGVGSNRVGWGSQR